MWLLLNVLYYREVAYEILCDYFLHFIWVRGCYCQHPKHPSYYGLVLFTVYLQLEFRPTLFVLFADSV